MRAFGQIIFVVNVPCGITSGHMLNFKGCFAQLLCYVLCELFPGVVLHPYCVVDH